METESAPLNLADLYARNADNLPIPRPDVVDRLRLPEAYQHATLQKGGEERYRKGLLAACRGYVMEFDRVEAGGLWLTLAGTSGLGKSHGAAAVANEITTLHVPHRKFDIYWLATSWELPKLFDYRTFGMQEEYWRMRNRIMNCELLVVDDLLHAADYSMHKEFIFGVYDYRFQRRKMVITTLNGAIRPDDWSAVEAAFNGPFARRLAEKSTGFTWSG
jgi:hypothetical protein